MKTVTFSLLSAIAFLSVGLTTAHLKEEWTKPLQEGDKVPQVEFLTRVRTTEQTENPFDWKILNTDDYFKGKRVVLFALPGAFTPTCSASHLPGYDELYDEIKAQNVDEIYCK